MIFLLSERAVHCSDMMKEVDPYKIGSVVNKQRNVVEPLSFLQSTQVAVVSLLRSDA